MEDMQAHQHADSEPYLSRSDTVIGTNACSHPLLSNHFS